MAGYDKLEVREKLEIEDIYTLLLEFGGEPEYSSFGIISRTICHNPAHEGSRKLYYYENSDLFRCYTDCADSFDIFELVQKVSAIQWHKSMDLNAAIYYVAVKFGIAPDFGQNSDDTVNAEDWEAFEKYSHIKDIEIKDLKVTLEEYDKTVLDKLRYDIKLTPWLKEHMTQEVLDEARIGYWLGGDQITIPHYDKDGRFVGLRGRTMCKDEAAAYGKYRPIKILDTQYNHALSMNLYNLNFSKDNIKKMGKAIIFESEKSCLIYRSYFGKDADISVACCGSNISAYQIQMLLDAGAKEIIVAFDRQFQAIGDKEWEHLTKNFKKIYNKYKNYALISFIVDKDMITSYKAAPIDEGKQKFFKLFNERVVL